MGKASKSATPKFLRHRVLLSAEAVLVVALAKDWVVGWVKAQALPDWLKVVFIMAVTVGILGGLFLFAEQVTQRSVARTHQVVQALPLPTPYLLIHALILFALYLVYAHVHGFAVWPYLK
ncbi:MAG: hypothetical protein H0W72_08705 [Planctomycetes bacterium]|nr:hypothetical protein [Planctomycetota bacterium]